MKSLVSRYEITALKVSKHCPKKCKAVLTKVENNIIYGNDRLTVSLNSLLINQNIKVEVQTWARKLRMGYRKNRE